MTPNLIISVVLTSAVPGTGKLEGYVDAIVRVELATGHFRYIALILERGSDYVLRRPLAYLDWLEYDAYPWLALHGSSPEALEQAIEERAWS